MVKDPWMTTKWRPIYPTDVSQGVEKHEFPAACLLYDEQIFSNHYDPIHEPVT